jgi:hypothetical protein
MQAEVNQSAPAQTSGNVVSKRNVFTAAVVVAVLIFLFLGAHATFNGSPTQDTAVVADDAPSVSVGGAVIQGANGGSTAAAGPTKPIDLTFHGYRCTIDCMGHMIGYKIARAEGKTRIGDCPSAPASMRSLQEGCWAAVGREGPSPG